MLTSPVSLDDRHRINLIRRTKPAGAVAHAGFAELHHIVDGSGTLVTGPITYLDVRWAEK
jgi:hypothetical protein